MNRRIYELLVVPVLLPRLRIDPYRSSVCSIYPRLNVLDRTGRLLEFGARNEESQRGGDRVEVRESAGVGQQVELRSGEVHMASRRSRHG